MAKEISENIGSFDIMGSLQKAIKLLEEIQSKYGNQYHVINLYHDSYKATITGIRHENAKEREKRLSKCRKSWDARKKKKLLDEISKKSVEELQDIVGN